ncbi:uncharacterized protein LOC110061911 [Orbicella faveolata]|uniref:uncharacterized protein LOC110061911 n=1 Tax=Orbicella faveolata TaxID=48498 RepID=UPI0009E54310|nr:uncharacterized protein LOC110061911 [Orbicella faveolata]
MLKTCTLEVTGEIQGAFQLAVLLKTLDFKKAKSCVKRLRENLERIFREDSTLAYELGDDLMGTGIQFFTNNCFKEAAEYFTEVIRLVCEFNFIREAYIYQAKCYLNLVSSMIAFHEMFRTLTRNDSY